MPTVLRIRGLRVAVYPNDHSPAHVHVIGPGWSVVVNLIDLEVRAAIGCTEPNAQRALNLVDEQRALLMDAWKQYHG